jgi:hypothetical protein
VRCNDGWTGSGKINQCGIDAIHAGARHQSNKKLCHVVMIFAVAWMTALQAEA